MPLKKRKTAFPEEIVECGKRIPLVFKELKKRKKESAAKRLDRPVWGKQAVFSTKAC